MGLVALLHRLVLSTEAVLGAIAQLLIVIKVAAVPAPVEREPPVVRVVPGVPGRVLHARAVALVDLQAALAKQTNRQTHLALTSRLVVVEVLEVYYSWRNGLQGLLKTHVDAPC